MKKPHENWFYFANQDLAFAKGGLRDGFFAHVCFLSQQAVEKSMKGYLVFQGKDYPKTHGLMTLLRLMDVDWLEEHRVSLKRLSEFYVPLRYPDAIAGSLPEGLPDKEDAGDAFEWATAIVETIEAHLV
ncbi:MAG: HEPN domain-containing protein [Deltaproteobacteria bacterium]|nr:HEPN domain-containing protein [Deltaproteobacteria bacterium]